MIEEQKRDLTEQLTLCDHCKTQIHLEDHNQGLVCNDRVFMCESCCQNLSRLEITMWSKSIDHAPTLRPIGIWLREYRQYHSL